MEIMSIIFSSCFPLGRADSNFFDRSIFVVFFALTHFGMIETFYGIFSILLFVHLLVNIIMFVQATPTTLLVFSLNYIVYV